MIVDPDGSDGDRVRVGGGSRWGRAKPVGAVRRRYTGSVAQEVGRQASALDFANLATLLVAGALPGATRIACARRGLVLRPGTGRNWRLLDLLSDVVHERDGPQLRDPGVYVALQPGQSRLLTGS